MLRASIRGAGLDNLRKALTEHLDFKTSGSFRGEQTNSIESVGWLNDTERERLEEDVKAGIKFVVYSYWTPIAWVRKDGEVYRVKQKFTNTTGRHKGFTHWLEEAA